MVRTIPLFCPLRSCASPSIPSTATTINASAGHVVGVGTLATSSTSVNSSSAMSSIPPTGRIIDASATHVLGVGSVGTGRDKMHNNSDVLGCHGDQPLRTTIDTTFV